MTNFANEAGKCEALCKWRVRCCSLRIEINTTLGHWRVIFVGQLLCISVCYLTVVIIISIIRLRLHPRFARVYAERVKSFIYSQKGEGGGACVSFQPGIETRNCVHRANYECTFIDAYVISRGRRRRESRDCVTSSSSCLCIRDDRTRQPALFIDRSRPQDGVSVRGFKASRRERAEALRFSQSTIAIGFAS